MLSFQLQIENYFCCKKEAHTGKARIYRTAKNLKKKLCPQEKNFIRFSMKGMLKKRTWNVNW